jgi:hypothetical protein
MLGRRLWRKGTMEGWVGRLLERWCGKMDAGDGAVGGVDGS